MSTPNAFAHLVRPDGSLVEIDDMLSIGRASGNQLVLAHESVSRRHALIHAQGEGEYWLVDFGSSNGTSVNDRPLVQPARLRDGDAVSFGDIALVFHCGSAPAVKTLANSTVVRVNTRRHWLLLADLAGFTPLSQQVMPAELARIVGGWISAVRDIVEENEGIIFRYLGDAVLTGWRSFPDTPPKIVSCLSALATLQKTGRHPAFRVAVHMGDVTSSGSLASAEMGMLGADVNFLFRMEKVGAKLAAPVLFSSAAAFALEKQRIFASAGLHNLKGFPGTHEFWL